MSSLAVVQRLHEHRMWVNHKLLDAVEALPPATLRAQHAIGQGNLWRSLMHMYAAEWAWLAALGGNEDPVLPGDRPDGLPGNQEATGGVKSLAELRAAWTKADEAWKGYLASLTESDLAEPVYKVSSLQRTRQGCRRIDVLLHVCTHAHYTAAQTINMLRQSGAASLPDSMLISLARAEFKANSG